MPSWQEQRLVLPPIYYQQRQCLVGRIVVNADQSGLQEERRQMCVKLLLRGEVLLYPCQFVSGTERYFNPSGQRVVAS
jgi:hypothetical protein